MELPVQSPRKTSYTIETKNLSYRFPPPIKKFNWQYYKNTTLSNTYRYILKNVDLEAKPGEVTAIAGSSGAGKTTLLEVLAGMTSPSRISGQVFVNDSPMDVVNFRRVSGYVTQDDTLFPLLTVEETIMYSARLRLSGGWVEAAARAREVLKELGLDHIAGSRIGNGISGGEKRRISIGVDLVHDPAVLLIDEPTSGLDSASALHVVSLLKEMAKNRGKTIVLTIHQPGFRILELFNRVVLLSEGSVLHHGSLKLLEAKIKAAGHCIPRNVNVLEYALDATESLIIETSSSPDERLSIVDEKSETKDSEECKLEEKKDQEQDSRRIEGPKVQAKHVFYANSQCGEVLILGQRFCKNTIRTKQLFAARIVQSIVAGFGLGTIFMNVKSDAAGRVALQTRLGFFAFSLTFLLSSTTEGLPIYLKERRILMKETSRGAYRVSSYVIANTIIFLPFLLMVALLYTTPVYWLVGLRREIDGFLYFSLVVWMVVLMANSFVACFSALVPNFIMGNSLIAGMMGSFFLFSGYFISKKNIPNYWIFMHYLSLFKYPFESFMINEYGGKEGRNMCVDREGEVCVLYGDGFLRQQGLKDSQKWSNLGVMLGFICGYRLLCYLILWYRCYPRRK